MGNHKKIELNHEHFLPARTSTYDLLINISQHNLSYAIINREKELLEVLFEAELHTSVEAGLIELVEQQSVLRLPFKTVKICIDSFDYTFIPQRLFDHSSLLAYTKYLISPGHKDIIINNIRPARIKNVFSVPDEMKQLLADLFPSSQIFHQGTVFIEGIRRVMKDSVKTSLFLCLKNSILQIAVIDQTGLVFYNVFDSSTADDLNYFLLLTVRGLSMNLHQTTLSVAGDITLGSDHYSRIRKYFDDVAFIDSKRIINQPEIFDRIPSQSHFTLLALHLCE